MATLRNHTLIYDRDCPMCRLYTGAFVTHDWLDAQGRLPYSEVTDDSFPQLDLQRAKDEIALVNRETGEVVYGLESLVTVIRARWPAGAKLFRYPMLRRPLQYLYSFISYNRKVIAAVRPSGRPCNPSFHFGYRIAYLVVTFLIVSAILTSYAHALGALLPPGNTEREYLICGGQILFQGAVLYTRNRARLMDYLGNMMTVSLVGALALLPVLLLSYWLKGMPALFAGYFLVVAAGMLLEHIRRMKLLHLGILPSITWVLYRLLALAVILL